MSTDKLIENPQNRWATLRDLYLKNWLENISGYYTTDNYIRWIEKIPTIKHWFVYSLNGHWSDGTFAVLDRNQLFFNTLDDSNIRLTRLLSLLDWSEFESLLEYVDSIWPKRSATLTYLQKLSELNSNLCLITNTGKLISLCLRSPSGPLAALQVDDEFKRRGFGSLTLKLMTINLSQLGHDSSCCVVLNNIALHKMFKKNGFKVIVNILFITIKQAVSFVFE